MTGRAILRWILAAFYLIAGIAHLASPATFMPDGQGVSAGLTVLALSTIWYVQLQIRWFCRDLNVGVLLATWLVLRALVVAIVLFFIVALLIGLEAKNLS